uniref:Uncharacterized protein n=1 Tax=Arundo donax TaxID=35708 RepID=A0A0A9CN35_ARUDO
MSQSPFAVSLKRNLIALFTCTFFFEICQLILTFHLAPLEFVGGSEVNLF